MRGNIQPGDVILALIRGGQATEVKSAAQLNELLSKAEKGASVTLQVKRGETTFYSTLKINNGDQ